MGESPRTLLQRGLAYVESWPIAGSAETGCHRHHHLKGSQPAGSCRPKIQAIAAEHRERCRRFGTEYVEAALSAPGRKLMVVESSERKDDLVRDMIEVLTSFCARLYGRRSARHQAKKAMRAIGQ